MKQAIKWAGIAIGVPVALILILFLLFYFPPFQNWAVKKAAAYASETTGMDITVGSIHLQFPLDLALEQVRVLQPNDSLYHHIDTVADIHKTVVDVQLWPLLHKQVMVDELSFEQMKVNTTNFIHAARIKGNLKHLRLQAHGIDLGKEHVQVSHCLMEDGALSVELSDTVKKDTTPSSNFWKIAINDFHARNTDFTLHMPGDTMSVRAFLGNTIAQDAYLDLYKSLYTVRHLDWTHGAVNYDMNDEPYAKGFDASHLALSDLTLVADSFYYCDSKLDLKVRKACFKEKSGLSITSLVGPFSMDSTSLALPSLRLKTPTSDLLLSYRMDLNAFADSAPGALKAVIHGTLGKQDLMTFVGSSLPAPLARRWPNYPLAIDGTVGGNMQKLRLNDVNLKLPTAFRIVADGFAGNLMDMDHLKADVDVDATTYDLSFITAMLDRDLMKTIRIPRGIGFRGNVKVDGQQYASRFMLTQGGGSIHGHAALDARRMAYTAVLKTKAFPLQHFVPSMGLHPLTADIDVKGAGTDFMSPRTTLHARGNIRRFRYDSYDLSGVQATANMSGGNIHAGINSHNPMFLGEATLDALTNGKMLRATVAGDFNKVDLYRLGLVDDPLTASLCAHIDLATDLKHYYKAQGMLSDIAILDAKQLHRPEDIVLDVLTTRDTTHAIVDCGDFHLNMDGSGGYERLLSQLNRVMAEGEKQFKEKYIDQVLLRQKLPVARIYLTAGTDNIVCRILRRQGIDLHNAFVDMDSSPITGLNGTMQFDSLVVDSFQIDTVRVKFLSDDKGMSYTAQLRNGPKNPNYIFNALLEGALNEHGSSLTARVYDKADRLGLRFSLQGSMEQHGISFHLFGDNPIIGYKEFSVNDSNYVYLGDDRRVSANLIMKAKDGMGVQVYSNDENTDALQDVTVTLHQFSIGDALAMIPYTPDMTGILDGDFHLVQTSEELSISSSVNVDDFIYEQCPMGNLGTEFTYMPKSDGSHYVDGTLTKDGDEIGTLTGTYRSQGKGYLDAVLGLDRLPMDLANGFIPDKLFGFRGYGEGSLTVKGALDKPDVNGEVYLDSCYMFSEPYGVEVRFANDPVTITSSRLLFENFEVFANNDSPLNVEGYFDFADVSRMMMNVRMRAKNFELIDAKETNRSEAYGKAFINFYGTMSGLMDNLSMRGRVDVLGTTDLCYNLKDSPLSTDNQLEGLVEFTNFSDTIQDAVNRPPLTGFNMDLTLNIDDGAHIDAFLNTDHSNYVDVTGGGTMRMQYNNVDNIRLTGRYTIGSGEMKYSLPVIPLKTFTIQDGSYIEFRGDPMNPALNITASEETKSTVGSDSGEGRVVKFNCGVVVTKTLADMGLEFTIDAPEDMTIHNQLQSMSKEERGKLAVTMLTTGMYLADGNTNQFTMNSALSAFLNSQINQISNKALRTLDVSFGVDNSFGSNGAMHTDYNFKFAKRFWNNRLRIVIGGKFSSGSDVTVQNETFFDNVTFEYRMSPVSNKYLRLFYERDSYDWLEGNVSKFGGGFLWKRKMRHFKDLWNFRDNSDVDVVPTLDADSVRTHRADSIKAEKQSR